MRLRPLLRFIRNREGNTAIMFAVAMLPLMYLTGMTVDYVRAATLRTKLNALADTAALAAVTPSMLSQGDSASTAIAQQIFNSQAQLLSGLVYDPKNLTISVTDNNGNRAVVVSYTAAAKPAFPSILGRTSIALAGASTASAGLAPNIDFYLLLDNSPSMAIAATTSGINTMVANTQPQGGCAFACHQSNPQADSLQNKDSQGQVDPSIDNYQLAKNLGVSTRMDMLRQATMSLMDTASTAMTSNNAKYRMAIYTFNASGANTITSLTSSMSTAKALASNIDVLQVYKNNWLASGNKNSDEDTDFETAMSNVNATMPTPGNGTNAQGDTPQKVLFLVSDGVDDNNVGGSRNQAMFDTGWCDTVKKRGIRIAVLYTVYLPLPTNAWYNTYISPFQPQIAGNMQSCASPGLYFSVSTDDDITAAMRTLFNQALQSAHLTK
jgi:Flp pilus assembly protein TadG